MNKSLLALCGAALFLAMIGQAANPSLAAAQTALKPAAKKPATPKKPAAAPAKPAEKLAEPASAEEAAKVLDLRTFPRMEGATVNSIHSLGTLMYECKGKPKEAFEFQRQQLVKRGFKELPGSYIEPQTCSGKFVKDGFHVAASASELSGDPDKVGWSSIALVNDGNVALEKLPVPPGVKPFHPTSYRAAYTTDAKPAETAAACRKLLLAAGWEPYGQMSPNENQPDMSMQYFKRNAIKLQSWVMTTPADGGKTLIQYDTELLSADLPAPPEVADPRYDDSQKKLWFESPEEQTEAIFAFYQKRLTEKGWKATTDHPIKDDERKTQFLVYRNSQKDLLALDLVEYSGKVGVTLKHQTAAEVAEEERIFKERAKLEKEKLAKENMIVKVAVPLPALAENLDQKDPNLFEFTLATGNGATALGKFQEHFLKAGWTEEKGSDLDETSGRLSFKKGYAQLTFSYFDLGISDVEITVAGTKNVVLEAVPSKEKPAEGKPKPGKKPAAPGIPGLPELPPGVELPKDVEELLKKALEAGNKKPPPKKEATPKDEEE